MWWVKLFGVQEINKAIDGIFKVLDEAFFTDEEKAQLKLMHEKVKSLSLDKRHEILLKMVAHKSPFMGGWLAFLGWVCSFFFLYDHFLGRFMQWWLNVPFHPKGTKEFLVALVGLAGFKGIRDFFKKK